jgi:hypothetical protein
VPVPQRVKELSFREFFIAIASADGRFIAVGRDRSGKQVARAEGPSVAQVEADLKSELLQLSNDFVDLPGAINLFRRAFPGGFHSGFYDYYEREYKSKAATYVQWALAKERLKQLVSSNQDAEIAEAAIRSLGQTNLTSHYERIALRNALRKPSVSKEFGRALIELLYIDIGSGIDHLSSILGPENAAKWPVITYFPFLLRPDRDMLLKPDLAQRCAHRLGYELDYDTSPNAHTYRSYLGVIDHVRDGILSLEPRDNIDVQTFMYVVGKEGYVAEAIADRKKYEAKSM